MLNPPERYHQSVAPLQRELERELRKATDLSSPSHTRSSHFF